MSTDVFDAQTALRIFGIKLLLTTTTFSPGRNNDEVKPDVDHTNDEPEIFFSKEGICGIMVSDCIGPICNFVC